MMTMPRARGVDRILRAAWAQGTLLAGVGAGAVCRFEQGLTDPVPGKLGALDCLGPLPGSRSQRYAGENERRPRCHRSIAGGEIEPGFGVNDNEALHFRGEALSAVVSSRDCASARMVEGGSKGAAETRLDVSNALNAPDSCQPAPAKQHVEMKLP